MYHHDNPVQLTIARKKVPESGASRIRSQRNPAKDVTHQRRNSTPKSRKCVAENQECLLLMILKLLTISCCANWNLKLSTFPKYESRSPFRC